jgi:hypothetical protein
LRKSARTLTPRSKAKTNIVGHNDRSGVDGFSPGTTDIVPFQPLSEILDTGLANHGGPTRTHALVAGSPPLVMQSKMTPVYWQLAISAGFEGRRMAMAGPPVTLAPTSSKSISINSRQNLL